MMRRPVNGPNLLHTYAVFRCRTERPPTSDAEGGRLRGAHGDQTLRERLKCGAWEDCRAFRAGVSCAASASASACGARARCCSASAPRHRRRRQSRRRRVRNCAWDRGRDCGRGRAQAWEYGPVFVFAVQTRRGQRSGCYQAGAIRQRWPMGCAMARQGARGCRSARLGRPMTSAPRVCRGTFQHRRGKEPDSGRCGLGELISTAGMAGAVAAQ